MHLTSIQVLSHLHPGPKIRIWPPCMLHLTFIWISPSRSQELHFHPAPIPLTSRSPDVPHLQLGPVSLLSKSQYPRLISIQVTSRLPSRSRQLHITSIQIFMFHLQPGLNIRVSPFRSHLTPIYIPQIASQLHPGPISSHPGPKVCVSLPSRPHFTPIHISNLHLTCIQVTSHLHAGTKIFISPLCHVSPPFKSPGLHLTCIQVPSNSIQVPKFVSRLHPGHILSPPRSQYSCHISIQVTSRLHPGPDPGPENCTSAPSKSHLTSPSTEDLCSPPSMYHLTCIRVPGTSQSHLLLCHVSPPFRSQESRLSSIHVPSHFIHLLNFIWDSPPSRLCLTSIQNLIQMHKGPNMHVSHSLMLRLTCIQAMRAASHPPLGLHLRLTSIQVVSHLHPEIDSNASRSQYARIPAIDAASHLHPGHESSISPPSRSPDVRLTSIQVPSLLRLDPNICVSHRYRSHLISTQVMRISSKLYPGPISPHSMSGDLCLTSVHVMSHFHPSHQNCIAAPSGSCLTSIQIPGFVFPLQPVVSRSREFHFISIQVPSHPHAYLKTCVLPLFMSRLTSLQIRRFVSHLHPGQSIQVVSYLHVGPENCISAPWGLISTPSKSQILHLTSIQVLSQPQAAFEICTSPLARSCLSSVPTPRFASYLHLG